MAGGSLDGYYLPDGRRFGPVQTVVVPSATTSHVECTAEERARMGIPEGLIRYSTGIEDPNDLTADFEQALAHI